MSAVTFFSGAFCGAKQIVTELVRVTGYSLLTDELVVSQASRLAGVEATRFNHCFSEQPSVFNPFTRERERLIAWLRLALAELIHPQLSDGCWLLNGFSSHLLPATFDPVLRVCLIADTPHRLKQVMAYHHISRSKATSLLGAQDRQRAHWVQMLKGCQDPWAASLYDMVLPTHSQSPEQLITLIRKGLEADALQPTTESEQAVKTFLQTALLETTLAAAGHVASVTLDNHTIRLSLDRPVLMRDRLEQELEAILRAAGEKRPVEFKIPANTEETSNRCVYRAYNPDQPSKVLLVDDEREFVQTLSERLGMRDIGSAVAFDGESALALVQADTPEVMLLDLQMPGINGVEVLRRVKTEHPEIEVIILTGHGTATDRDQCMQLGAFAYLEKPVDIDILSDTLQRANARMRQKCKPEP